MNEYIVDGQLYRVSDDKLEKFLKEFPNAVLKEQSIEPVKPTSVVPSATAENEIALNTELPLEDGSLESEEKGLSGPSLVDGVVAEMKARREKGNKNMLLNKILNISKLKPKWAKFWDKFFIFVLKKSLAVITNK